MNVPVVKILKKKSYLAMVRNAAKGENQMFRNLWATVDGAETDIVDGGALACSFFLSAILYVNKLTRDMHANMLGLEKDLEASGWTQVREPAEGDVVIWEPRPPKKERPFEPTQLHAGVVVGENEVVSNDSNAELRPRIFPLNYDGARKIIRIWRYPDLK